MTDQAVDITKLARLIEQAEDAEAAATRQVGYLLDRIAYTVAQEQRHQENGQACRINGDAIEGAARDLVRWIGEAKVAGRRAEELRSLLG